MRYRRGVRRLRRGARAAPCIAAAAIVTSPVQMSTLGRGLSAAALNWWRRLRAGVHRDMATPKTHPRPTRGGNPKSTRKAKPLIPGRCVTEPWPGDARNRMNVDPEKFGVRRWLCGLGCGFLACRPPCVYFQGKRRRIPHGRYGADAKMMPGAPTVRFAATPDVRNGSHTLVRAGDGSPISPPDLSFF